MQCSVTGCDKPARKMSWCYMHYQRWFRYGTLADPTPTPESRFWSQVTRGGANECWPWTGYVNEDGYGRIRIGKGNRTGVHRFSYELANGPLAEDLTVDHECHNSDKTCNGGRSCAHRRCVNPAHLAGKLLVENVESSTHTVVSINRAKTHCPNGHPYDYVKASGSRWCSICQKRAQRESKTRERAAERLVNPPKVRHLSEAERSAIIASYTGNFGEKAGLARQFGVSKSAIGRLLRKAHGQ